MIRHLLRRALAHGLVLLGIPERIKRRALKGEFILSIYFHNPSKALFEFCIAWLVENGFIFLSTKDIIDLAKSRKPMPKGAALVTLDDGWQTNEENVVEVANKFRVPVTIFLATDAVEGGNFWWTAYGESKDGAARIEKLKKISNYERLRIVTAECGDLPKCRDALTVKQVSRIAKSHYISFGGHTKSHPILINCRDIEVYRELNLSKAKIENWTLSPVLSFAYPNGDYSKREIDLVAEAGYEAAFTTRPDYLTQERLRRVYEIPRFCIFENSSKSEAICRMTGVWQTLITNRLKSLLTH